MKNRVLPLFLAALAVLLFASAPLPAADENQGNTHEGKLVTVAGNKILMQTGNDRHTHLLSSDATITCDGKACKLADLKPGMRIKVTTKQGDKKVAVRVDAFKGSGGKDKR